jgi:glutamyl-tRNA synthetase
MIITRFAPSPTGELHIGGVRTALFNYAYAKKNNGKFLIRIEDTDLERSTKEYEKNILDSLSSIGLKSDENPINQSKRSDLYIAAAQKLYDEGHAYYCNCSKERLDHLRSSLQAEGKKPQYDGKCRNLNLAMGEDTVLRLKTPAEGIIIVKDYVRGEIAFENSELDDLIILRSDKSPTYHLCNVVDDYEQGVTTVIRGEDHLSNTPRQIHIQNALGFPQLEYAHLPLVLGNDKKRLSKRHAATGLAAYQSKGYLNSAILNCLARLGWSKGDKEVFYLEDLINDFNLNDIQKAGAVFDISKLDYLNAQHMANLSNEDFEVHLMKFINSDKLIKHKHKDLLIESLRSSGNTFIEVANNLNPFLNQIDSYNEKAISKFVEPNLHILRNIFESLQNLKDWNESVLDIFLDDFKIKNSLKTPQVNMPIRVALTGSTNSPSLGRTLYLFGKKESIKRINDLILFKNEK